MKVKEILIFIGVLLTAVVISFFIGKKNGIKKTEKWYKDNIDTATTIQVDTNKAEHPIHDTVYHDKPVYYPVYIDSEIPEPQIIYKDSIVYVRLEKTIKEYRKENYYARISGVDPSLDYIETYNKTVTNTVYVPQKIVPKKNFIEIDGTFMYNKSPMLPVTASVGRKVGPLEFSAGGGYDFLQKGVVLKSGIKLKFEF